MIKGWQQGKDRAGSSGVWADDIRSLKSSKKYLFPYATLKKKKGKTGVIVKRIYSPTGNRTPGTTVRAWNVTNYTIEEVLLTSGVFQLLNLL
jgi:hypothetical protein